MRYVKELSNRNKIVSESTCKADFRSADNAAYTIKFVFKGSECCTVNTRKLNIFPDSFVILNAGTNYHSEIDSITPVNTFSVCLDSLFVQDFSTLFMQNCDQLLERKEPVGNTLFTEALYPFKGDIWYNIHHLRNQISGGLDNEMLMNEYLHHCLLNYYKIYQQEVAQKMNSLHFTRAKTREEILKRLLLAKDFINSNFNQAVSLEAISANCFLSVNHLLRTFKEAYGISPYQYLMRLRVQRARYLLKETDYPINDIVCLVGFENVSSFIRLFKQLVGETPFKYRIAEH